jgi:hypothetical protein
MNRVVLQARQTTYAGGFDYLESIHGLLKSLKIRAQVAPFLLILWAKKAANTTHAFLNFLAYLRIMKGR